MRVINLAFRNAESFFIERDRVDRPAVVEFLQKGEFLIAGQEPTTAGCVYLELRGERGYIGLLSVDPSRQNDGLGSRLMIAAEDRARELGCRFADLQIVNLRRELPAFYRKRGYLETGGSLPPGPGHQAAVPLHQNVEEPDVEEPGWLGRAALAAITESLHPPQFPPAFPGRSACVLRPSRWQGGHLGKTRRERGQSSPSLRC